MQLPQIKLAPALLLAFFWPVLTVHASQSTVRKPQDRINIQPRKIVIVRSSALTKQFPERRKAIVNYPIVSGLRDAATLNRVRSALEIKNIFGYSLDDYRDDTWLDEFGYTVNHNADYLLDISFTQSGLAAYPDEHQKHLLISLRDGHIVKARDVFEADRLQALAALVDRELQGEIQQLAKQNLAEATDAEQRASISGAYQNLKFEVANLDEFSVGPKGITFLYDAGFPHVIKALEPAGRYFFSYSALGKYIRPDGLLAKFRG